jgi:crotonobetainyl-CoA:carnitine CoA-transferase CaiB-like acyl-CoA transferase
MRAIAEVIDHPQMAARGRWTTVSTSAGPVATLRPPVTAPQWSERTDPVPGVGEHTGRVLEWIGMAEREPAQPHPGPGSAKGEQ